MNKIAFRNLLFLILLVVNLVVTIQTKNQLKELNELFQPTQSGTPDYIILEPVPNVWTTRTNRRTQDGAVKEF